MDIFAGLSPDETDTIEINNLKDHKKYQKKLKHKKERLNKCDCPIQKEKLIYEIKIIEVEIDEYLNRNKGIPVKKYKPKPEVKQEFVFNKKEIRNFNEKRKRENKEKAEAEWEERKEREEETCEHWDKWKRRSESWDNEERVRKVKRDEEYHKKYKQQQQQQQQEQQEQQGDQTRQQKRRQQRQQQKQEKQQRQQQRRREKRKDSEKNKSEEEVNKEPFDLKPFIKEFNMKLKDIPKDIMSLNHMFSLEDYKKLSRKYHPDKLSGKQDFMYILNGIRYHYVPNKQENDETWIK